MDIVYRICFDPRRIMQDEGLMRSFIMFRLIPPNAPASASPIISKASCTGKAVSVSYFSMGKRYRAVIPLSFAPPSIMPVSRVTALNNTIRSLRSKQAGARDIVNAVENACVSTRSIYPTIDLGLVADVKKFAPHLATECSVKP